MPIVMETSKIAGTNYSFSNQRIDTLIGATEYTLVTLVIDVSGSVVDFKDQIEKMIKTVSRACRKDKRVDNLLLRVVLFNSSVDEVHGFQVLANCNDALYDGIVYPSGMTALYDAVYTATKAMTDFGKNLVDQDYSVNAALFVVTDGADNASKVTMKMVKEAIEDAKKGEVVESIMPVLIGVNVDSTDLNQYLEAFKNEAGFQQYVAIDKADENNLAKLANFISKSISSQSQHLNTGGPSQSLTF